MYEVTAYDTEYGPVSSWDFESRLNAIEWAKMLEHDYGQECMAAVSLTASLCAGRHDFPAEVTGSIFPQDVDPTDVLGLENMTESVVRGIDGLKLYVSGLTVALVAVINACHKYGVSLVLMHYNRETREYYSQEVR